MVLFLQLISEVLTSSDRIKFDVVVLLVSFLKDSSNLNRGIGSLFVTG